MIKRTIWKADPGRDLAITAQAAAWLARLHADDRGERDEAAFRVWLAEHPSHQAAFARVTDAWEAAGGLKAELGASWQIPRSSGDCATVGCGERPED